MKEIIWILTEKKRKYFLISQVHYNILYLPFNIMADKLHQPRTCLLYRNTVISQVK